MSFILLIAVVVALAWTPILLVRSSLALAGVVFVVLANCFSLEFMSIDVGPINMSIERLFLLALPVAYVVQRRLGQLDPKPLGRADWALFGFVGFAVLSTFMHDWRSASDVGASVVPHLINGYLIPLALFWIVRQTKIEARELRGVYVGFVAFGVYLALTGIAESQGAWSFVFPKYIANPEIGLHFGRARGPMVHSVTYGMALATSMFCGWMLWPGSSRGAKLALILLLPLALASLYFSKTRSVWLGAALGTGVLMLTQLRGAWRPLLLGGAVGGGLLVAVMKFDSIVAFDRKDNTAEQTRESVEARGSFLYVSWQMFKDRPLLGFGFGQFPTSKLPYLADRETDLQLEAIRPWSHHNTYLSVLTELGVVGLVLFVGVLAAWAGRGWRLLRDADAPTWVQNHGALMLAVLAMYAMQCMFHEMSFTARDNSLLFIFAALTSGLYATATRPAAAFSTRPELAWQWPSLRGATRS
ncbi:MAG: O-antigen ligase family protein [Pirellulales bacterium]